MLHTFFLLFQNTMYLFQSQCPIKDQYSCKCRYWSISHMMFTEVAQLIVCSYPQLEVCRCRACLGQARWTRTPGGQQWGTGLCPWRRLTSPRASTQPVQPGSAPRPRWAPVPRGTTPSLSRLGERRCGPGTQEVRAELPPLLTSPWPTSNLELTCDLCHSHSLSHHLVILSSWHCTTLPLSLETTFVTHSGHLY